MYIFAKFVPDHIFLQNRDKLNIKNSFFEGFLFFAVLVVFSTNIILTRTTFFTERGNSVVIITAFSDTWTLIQLLQLLLS
jgi:hypothetical protein